MKQFPKVAILGGGVAGMSAAHELIERGFQVEVYEKQAIYVGGKARSVEVPNSASGDRKPLPGEHGFRFFPGFYKHITDTMKRIPFPGNKQGVYDNLVISTREMFARKGKPPIVSIVNFPKSFADLKVLIYGLTHADTGIPKDEVEFFAGKIWQLMTSSMERRKADYERISWLDYLDAKNKSEAYNKYLVGGVTRTLVAAQPSLMSTKTGGDVLLQLLFLMARPGAHADRVLNAPTNDAWLWPWLSYLKEKGVQYFHHHKTTDIECDTNENKVTKVLVLNQDTGETIEVKADYYIFAVPVEVMSGLVTKDLSEIDPVFSYLHELKEDTQWMNGIQFYLNTDVKLIRGHEMFIDSPWAITSISQIQFWEGFDISQYGNGAVKGILSIDISDWYTDGILHCKPAKDCTKQQIMEETWHQMEISLNIDGKKIIDKSMIIDWYLDRDIVIGGKDTNEKVESKGFTTINKEPLLVNRVNTWALRPEAFTQVKNMFLASDYIRTNTDLATMEGANEAARRAVNAIIQESNVSAPLCKIWNLHEPYILAPLRWADRKRYHQGLPWKNELGWFFKLIHHIWVFILKVIHIFK